MNNQFERDMDSLCDRLEISHNFDSVAQKERIIGILSAIKGYMTECGTTNEQGDLLREIGVLPPKPVTFREERLPLSNGLLMTIPEWFKACDAGCYCDDDGTGYWAKVEGDVMTTTGLTVFNTPREPGYATHVVWYNK